MSRPTSRGNIVLILVGILAVASSILFVVMGDLLAPKKSISDRATQEEYIQLVSENIRQLLDNPEFWNKAVTDPKNEMQCLSDPQLACELKAKPLSLPKPINGALISDGKGYFSSDNRVCEKMSDEACDLKLDITWEPLCTHPCQSEVDIKVVLSWGQRYQKEWSTRPQRVHEIVRTGKSVASMTTNNEPPPSSCQLIFTNRVFDLTDPNWLGDLNAEDCQNACAKAGYRYCVRFNLGYPNYTGPASGVCRGGNQESGRVCAGSGCGCNNGSCYDRSWICSSVRRDCLEHLKSGATVSGFYVIDPDGSGGRAPFATHCNMDLDGGGWTLFQIVDQTSRNAGAGQVNLNTDHCLDLDVPCRVAEKTGPYSTLMHTWKSCPVGYATISKSQFSDPNLACINAVGELKFQFNNGNSFSDAFKYWGDCSLTTGNQTRFGGVYAPTPTLSSSHHFVKSTTGLTVHSGAAGVANYSCPSGSDLFYLRDDR